MKLSVDPNECLGVYNFHAWGLTRRAITLFSVLINYAHSDKLRAATQDQQITQQPLHFMEIGFFDTQNTFYLIVKGLKNAFFMPLLWLHENSVFLA